MYVSMYYHGIIIIIIYYTLFIIMKYTLMIKCRVIVYNSIKYGL
jgi:hypothetical protein